nr:hypothetical protein CFP56_64606 [Quercus suber]
MEARRAPATIGRKIATMPAVRMNLAFARSHVLEKVTEQIFRSACVGISLGMASSTGGQLMLVPQPCKIIDRHVYSSRLHAGRSMYHDESMTRTYDPLDDAETIGPSTRPPRNSFVLYIISDLRTAECQQFEGGNTVRATRLPTNFANAPRPTLLFVLRPSRQSLTVRKDAKAFKPHEIWSMAMSERVTSQYTGAQISEANIEMRPRNFHQVMERHKPLATTTSSTRSVYRLLVLGRSDEVSTNSPLLQGTAPAGASKVE